MATRTKTKYESDRGVIHPITLDPATAAAAGTPPTAAISSDIKVKVSKTNRESGLRCRGVTLGRVIGTAPDTFIRYRFLPVLTATQWVGTTFAPGESVTVDSIVWTVVSRKPEDY